uniref:MAGUK p55 subfamily member 7 n=1 Tax=Ciona savignyi TaxID=51511 RepID=H2YGE0_CIOSA
QGATIAGDEKGNIVVARILKGGAADRSGLIHVNDILVEVNDVAAQGKKPEELIQLLAGLSGPLTFKLIPGEAVVEPRTEELYLRSRYKYHPKSDPLIPCQEAGLDFNPGDVLRVVSKDDASWWQAIKVGSSNYSSAQHSSVERAGLIPSIKLQTRRERLKKQSERKTTPSPSIKGSNLSLLSNDRKTACKYFILVLIWCLENGVGNTHSPTYRPIVLVGPQGVGRNELKDRLIDSNPAHYGVPVPHTSRSKQIGEMDGKDYHFVTREYMESGIRDNLFLEYGEYKGNLYGTSLSAVHTVIQNHQVCVLTPYPQALSVLRCKEMKPYIVFIQPPTLDQLDTMGIPGDQDELSNLVNRGERMEAAYGRLFDARIVNDNVDAAFAQLKEISFFLENDLQWLPSEWMD